MFIPGCDQIAQIELKQHHMTSLDSNMVILECK